MIARRAAWLLCGALLLAVPDAAAGPYDPALRFRTYRTPHFTIHFHHGEERLAARLADIAESAHARLSRAAGRAGPHAHVVLADQADLSNGFATVVPWNAIVIYAAPPSGADTIGNTDDWLDYVFTHEYAHVLHLDRSRGWARIARGIFGRSAVAFPNLSLPLWHIEGLATLTESAEGEGRLHGGDFRAVVDVAARAGAFEPLDRVNGGLVDWPSGQGWYAYGARFHEYLLREYGRDRLVALSERTAGRLPFVTAGAFRAVYGKSLGDLWQDFRRDVEREVASPPPTEQGRRLTRLGYFVDAPREDAQGTLYASAADAHRFPAVYKVRPEGTTEVVERYGGTGLSVHGAAIIFDQLEFTRGVALFSDLYAYGPGTGRTRRSRPRPTSRHRERRSSTRRRGRDVRPPAGDRPVTSAARPTWCRHRPRCARARAGPTPGADARPSSPPRRRESAAPARRRRAEWPPACGHPVTRPDRQGAPHASTVASCRCRGHRRRDR